MLTFVSVWGSVVPSSPVPREWMAPGLSADFLRIAPPPPMPLWASPKTREHALALMRSKSPHELWMLGAADELGEPSSGEWKPLEVAEWAKRS